MTFDFIDRQVIVSVFPYIKADWAVSDRQLGALSSVVSITIALGALPISWITDRWSRVKSIAVMGTVWSLATIACAFSQNYQQLLLVRSLVGLGEAGYGPAGAALLSSLFPARMRSTVIGGFLAAASVGSVLGVVLGGMIAGKWGWQAAFGIVGMPGLFLSLLFLFVRDYRTICLPDPPAGKAPRDRTGRVRVVLQELFRAHSGIAAYIGGALQLITVSTAYTWLPSYLNRTYGLSPAKAGIQAALVIAAGTFGSVAWSYVADRASRRVVRNKLLVPASCGVITWILFGTAFAFLPAGNLQFLLIVAGGFTMSSTIGPVPAVALDVVHPALRASAGSMVVVVQNLFGLGFGPLIAGALSDAYGIQTALALIPLSCLFSAAILALGATRYERDLARVPTVPIVLNTA
jgi:predicted MFS family arabinose efflux permease